MRAMLLDRGNGQQRHGGLNVEVREIGCREFLPIAALHMRPILIANPPDFRSPTGYTNERGPAHLNRPNAPLTVGSRIFGSGFSSLECRNVGVEMSRIALIIAVLTAAFLPGLALAQPDAFWCGSRLIRERMAAADIVARCGQPDAIRVVEEPIYGTDTSGQRIQIGIRHTEYWTYRRGTGRFPAQLMVRDGIAEEIELIRQ